MRMHLRFHRLLLHRRGRSCAVWMPLTHQEEFIWCTLDSSVHDAGFSTFRKYQSHTTIEALAYPTARGESL